MKKINSRKLVLNRETLAEMTPDTLDDVAGGLALPNPKWTDLKQPIGTCFCPRQTFACAPNNSITFQPNVSIKPGLSIKPQITIHWTKTALK